MASLQQKAGSSQPGGNANQSTAADGQTDEETSADVLNPSDEQLAKAWGFSGRRPKLSREALIGLVAILSLLGLFGYVAVTKFRGGATPVAAKVDKDVKQAGGLDPFADDDKSVVKTEFEESSDKLPKKGSKGLASEDDLPLDIGNGQAEPTPNKRTAAKRITDDVENIEEIPFGDEPKVAKAPKVAQSSIDEMGDFDQEPLPVKPNRSKASSDIDFNDPPVKKRTQASSDFGNDEPALTKSEPIRLKQKLESSVPVEEQFEEPVRVNVASKPRDDFEKVPTRTRKPTRLPEQDQFVQNSPAPTVLDDRNARQPSPTSDLPQPTARKHHPLLREGEYLIEEGDNFCVICKKVYGSEKYYLALAEHNRNRVADPCRMRPGLIISAPPRETLEQQHAALIPKPKKAVEAKQEKPHSTQKVTAVLPPGMFSDEKGAKWYRVGKGDTLSEIAKAHLGRTTRADQIFNINRERLPNRDKLDVGQILLLPNDASPVRVADSGREAR